MHEDKRHVQKVMAVINLDVILCGFHVESTWDNEAGLASEHRAESFSNPAPTREEVEGP